MQLVPECKGSKAGSDMSEWHLRRYSLAERALRLLDSPSVRNPNSMLVLNPMRAGRKSAAVSIEFEPTRCNSKTFRWLVRSGDSFVPKRSGMVGQVCNP